MSETNLSIGDLSRATGFSTSAVRYYERVGILPEPERINGRRVYDTSVFQHLTMIRLAQQAGFTVAEIGELLQACGPSAKAAPSDWQDLAKKKITQMDETIQRAESMKRLLNAWLDCGCVSLKDCELIADRVPRIA